jgi:hypothetical protein
MKGFPPINPGIRIAKPDHLVIEVKYRFLARNSVPVYCLTVVDGQSLTLTERTPAAKNIPRFGGVV